MSISLTITNLDNGYSLEKKLEEEQYDALVASAQSRNVISLFPALLMPVRTNSLKSFASDFFLPTTLNHAIRVQGTVRQIFAILGALLLDILTLPIRLLTCIPRRIYNSCQTKHPIYVSVKEDGFNKGLFESGRVQVRQEWKTENKDVFAEYQELSGSMRTIYETTTHWREFNINFIEVPQYHHSKHYSEGSEIGRLEA